MFHSLDSVNSSPIVLSDFSRSSVEDDGYNTIFSGTGLLSFDIDFPRFDSEEMNPLFSSPSKDEFLPNVSVIQPNVTNPLDNFRGDYTYDQYGYYCLTIQADDSKIEPSQRSKKTCMKKKPVEIKRKPKQPCKKPIVLQPFASVWSIETSVRKLRDYQHGITSDDLDELA